MEGAEELAESLAAPELSPEELLEAAQTRAEIRAAIDALSPQLRAAVVMRYFYDLSEAEMAEAEGCPKGTIKRRLHDARSRLRRLLRLHDTTANAPETGAWVDR